MSFLFLIASVFHANNVSLSILCLVVLADAARAARLAFEANEERVESSIFELLFISYFLISIMIDFIL